MASSQEFPRGWVVSAKTASGGGTCSISRAGVAGVTQIITEIFAQFEFVAQPWIVQNRVNGAGTALASHTPTVNNLSILQSVLAFFLSTAAGPGFITNAISINNGASLVANPIISTSVPGSGELSLATEILGSAGTSVSAGFTNAAAANQIEDITITGEDIPVTPGGLSPGFNLTITDTPRLITYLAFPLQADQGSGDQETISDLNLMIPTGGGFVASFGAQAVGGLNQYMRIKGYDI